MVNAGAAALSLVGDEAIKRAASRLVDSLPLKAAKEKLEVLQFVLNKGLPKYLEANYAKCETIKTLLNRNDPISLDECFVPPDFRMKSQVLDSSAFLREAEKVGGKVVVTGLAGSGKSVFLKYCFRAVLQGGYTFYPIFFELRALNRAENTNGALLTFIYESIHSCCPEFTRAQFDHGLQSGAFYLLLDGFDELTPEVRDRVADEICEISRSFIKCAVVVTSRPSDEFVSWEGFTEARLLPFDLSKAVSYVSKLRFDEEKKGEFLEDLKEGLFEKNKEFLSNPLLAAMMLLTYDSFGEIPEKRHIFYAKCFDVLAREHDASKGRYKRELFSGLAMDQLERVFMFFCAFSYVERTFSFSRAQMEKYVLQAVEACGRSADVDCLIRDFRESISIMELVGLSYEFVHRSFQEYFYARFVVVDRKLSLESKIGWLVENFRLDDTVAMIADMDEIYFEDEFLLPRVAKLSRELAEFDAMANPAAVLSRFFSRIHASTRSIDGASGMNGIYFSHTNTRNSFFLSSALDFCAKMDNLGSDRLPQRGMTKEEAVSKLKAYGGEIKIHHSNNRKLIEVEANCFAARAQDSLGHLHKHLEAKQERRRAGIGGLIRKNYSSQA